MLGNNSHLEAELIRSPTHYVPIIGLQLQNFARSPNETGIVLVPSLLIS